MSEITEVVVPQTNPNDEHAVLVRWHVSAGSWVGAEQALATLETTKAAFDITAPKAGYAFFEQQPKSLVAVGSTIAWISTKNEPPAVMQGMASSNSKEEPIAEDSRFTRKALKLMKELDLRHEDFGPQERVDVAVVERVSRARQTKARTAAPDTAEALEQTTTKIIEAQMLGEVYRQVVPSGVTIALAHSKANRRLQECAATSGVTSLLELTIYEVARLLNDFPDLNGFYANGRAWHHNSVSVGFAINLGKGLRVPIVKGAAVLSLVDISKAVRDLSLRYMRSELTLDDQTGGSFTITDLSSFGVHHFVPVLNERQSAILGICAERPGTGYQDLVLIFDHRISDGMRAATFLGRLAERLEGAASSSV